MTGKILEAYEKHPNLSKKEKVRIDMLRRFGYYSTESNGHLSEYVSWYRKTPELINSWLSQPFGWSDGETGGYLRHCRENRNWFETDFPNWLKEPPKQFLPKNHSSEHGAYIIESLETGWVYRGHFNVMNNGTITNLPDECVVEVPGYVDRNGVSIPKVGDLPLGCAAVCSQSAWVQRLAVEAAKGRLEERRANGTFHGDKRDYQGAARNHTKTVEKMQTKAAYQREQAQKPDKTGAIE